MDCNKVKVIYLVGEGRSGTTLLEKMLAEQEDIFVAGELRYIWERSIKKNQLCSCGATFQECRVWQRIIQDIKEEIDTDLLIKNYNKIGRMRHYFIFNLLMKIYPIEFKSISNIYYKLYKNILKKTESQYVLDSSKHPMFAHILATHPNIELYTIHLIRDARAVTYSSMKKRIRPEIKDKIEYMPTYPSHISALAWKYVNFVAEGLEEKSNKYTRLKYEDMFFDIQNTLNYIYDFLKLEKINNNFIKSNTKLHLHANHTTSGNPMRFKSGDIEIKIDNEWKKKLSIKDKKIVEFICRRQLKNYHYID